MDEDSTYPTAVMKGYAGVGKTFTCNELIRSLKEQHLKVGVVAPTHKAVKVLNKNAIPNVEYRTIHSAMALKEQVNERTGEVFYAQDKMMKYSPPIADYQVLILDECSMLDDTLFHKLVDYIKRGLKIVFVGDPAQIPPVKHVDCIPFLKAKAWNMLVVELTEIMRQAADNPILEFATHIRGCYKTAQHIKAEGRINAKEEGIVKLSSADEEKVFRVYFGCENFKQDADYMKVIAWRNTTVNRYNKMIREVIYGRKDLPMILEGEKLILEESWSINKALRLNRNEDLEVVAVRLGERRVSYTVGGVKQEDALEVYQTDVVLPRSSKVFSLPIIHESSREALGSILNELKGYALKCYGVSRGRVWAEYYRVKRAIAWVNYGYAITGHKSQGSTYDNVLLLKWDIEANRSIEERNRILYTASTRPRYLLMIEP